MQGSTSATIEHAPEIVAPNLADVIVGISRLQQSDGDTDGFRHIFQPCHTAIAIEVAADAYMVDAAEANQM